MHLIKDEPEHHVKHETVVVQQLLDTGFVQVELVHRQTVNALMTDLKPEH